MAETEVPTGGSKIMHDTAQGAAFGFIYGSIQSVWAIPRLGDQLPKLSMQLSHIGRHTMVFAGVGLLFSASTEFAEAIRAKDDAINAGVGGLVAGTTIPAMLTKNARLAAATGVIAAAGMTAASFWEKQSDSAFDKYRERRFADRR